MHKHIYMRNHNDDNKGERHSLLEKYTSHFIWKGSKGLLKVLLWVSSNIYNLTLQQHQISVPSTEAILTF